MPPGQLAGCSSTGAISAARRTISFNGHRRRGSGKGTIAGLIISFGLYSQY